MNESELPEQSPEVHETIDSAPSEDSKAIPPTGRRFALRNVRKQLTDDELAQTGTQKMLLEMLEESENERDNIKSY